MANKATADRLSHAEYAAIDAINWSTLKWMRVSPLHYKYRRDNPEPDKPAFRKGRALHTLLLEPERFGREYVVWNQGAKTGNVWKSFKATYKHLTILDQKEYQDACNMRDAIRNHPIASRHLVDGITEKAITWIDPITGLRCKARVDSLNGHLVEVKTAQDVDPYRFMTAIARFGYYIQAPWYSDGLKEFGYETDRDPVMIVVESHEPYDVLTYQYDADVLQHGRDQKNRLIRKVAYHLEIDRWPGLCTESEWSIELPNWIDQLESTDPPKTVKFGDHSLFGGSND